MKLKTSEDHQQIGELSRSLGVTPRTLRLYEQMGLIDPPQRTEGRIRYYTKENLRRIRFVLKLKELGLPLQQMQELAEIYRETKMPDTIMPRLIELLDSHTDAIHRKIGKLSSLARAISEYRKRIVEYYGIPRKGPPPPPPHPPPPGELFASPSANASTIFPFSTFLYTKFIRMSFSPGSATSCAVVVTFLSV